MTKVAVVILNFNGKKYLEKFLPSVCEHSKNAEIYVADNKSTDDSIDYIKSSHPDVSIIELESNEGYSAGYNLALNQVKSEYYVLLNSDIEVTENWLDRPIELMENDVDISAVQPKILSFNDKQSFEYAGAAGGFIDIAGYPFCRGRIFLELEKDHGQYESEIPVMWASGACLFVRASDFRRVGGLDNDFFAHMEEIDFCWRLNNIGMKVLYTHMSVVYHVGGGTLPKSNPKKTYLNFRNGLTVLIKNVSFKTLLWVFPVRIVLDWVAAIKFLFFDSPQDFIAVVKAHIHFLFTIQKAVNKRRRTRRKTHPNLIYNRLIVFDHFIKKINKFPQLKNFN